MRRYSVLLICLLIVELVFAQASLQADRTSVLIGDQITISLAIENASVSEWVNPEVSIPDTSTQFVLLGESEISQLSPTSVINKSWRLAVFDTGQIVIPALEVNIQKGGSSRSYMTNDIPILVSGVVDSIGLAPIKEIIQEPAKFTDYLPYIGALIGLIALIAGIYFWRNRPKKEEAVIEIRDIRPAHQIALDALFELEGKKLWQGGLVKEYHAQLSQILRGYIEERFGIPALESTTSDLRVALKGELREDHYDEMMRMMSIEDLVKFAKATPPIEVHGEYMDFVRTFVNNTKLVPEVADEQ